MSDANNCPMAERHADPTEAGVHFTFGEGEQATFSRFLCRGAAGAAFDLTTRVGVPLVGHGGGVYVADDAGSYHQGAVYPAGVAMAGEHQVDALPAAARIVAQNGAQHLARVDAAGQFEASLNSGATYSTAAWNATGRGPFHWVVDHDGANQRLWINRRLADSDAVALGVPAGNIQVGRTGTARRLRCLPARPDVNALYLGDFARRVVYAWKPWRVGEGPAGGIATGAVGEGDWYCPSGGASLAFVWRHDLSEPGGGHLALTDSGALSMRRLDFMHTKMPSFGSWLVEYEVRNPAFGADGLIVGLTPQRGVDPTAAGSGSYWVTAGNNGGGWWRSSLYYQNGAQIDAVDCDVANVPAGTRCKLLLTRTVAGDWQTYTWRSSDNRWYWSTVTGNDVAALSSSYLTIAPRGAYVSRVTRYAGEMLPSELP